MGFFQEAYDAECAAIARALAVAAERAKRQGPHLHGCAAIARMTHDEPSPGQTYAFQARRAIAALCKREPTVEIEIRCCPAHK